MRFVGSRPAGIQGRNERLFALGPGRRRHDRREFRIARPGLHQHPDDRQFSGLVGVNEMRLHLRAFAAEGVLARMMEVELLEFEGLAVELDPAHVVTLGLDGMAIVFDLEGFGLPFDPERADIGDIGWFRLTGDCSDPMAQASYFLSILPQLATPSLPS